MMPSTQSKPPPRHSRRFEAIGTGWQIDTQRPLPQSLDDAIQERVERFDRTYSRFRDDSLVTRIASGVGVFEFPDDAAPLFDVYRRLYTATNGAMSPLVGRSLENLGYDRAYSLKPSAPAVAAPRWDETFAWDGHALTTAAPVTVDIGAAGKGYLVDLVGRILLDAGIAEFIVDASGDILHSGGSPIRVALEHPSDATKAIGVVNLEGNAICASASNRRSWGDGLHHVIDATTGLPTHKVVATWAIAGTALVADGIATALFFADPAEIADFYEFTFVRVWANGRIEFSPAINGEIFK